MGKFSGCLLASDFDGTLADPSGKIRPDVRDAIRYFIAQGGCFTVCTGRTRQGFHMYSPDIINAPVLLANGVTAFDYAKNTAAFLFGIDSSQAQLVDMLRDRYPDICIEMYSADLHSWAIRCNARSAAHFTAQDIVWSDVGSVREAVLPFVKVMLSCGAARGREIQSYLDGVIADYGLKYIPSTGDYVELIHRDAGKGAGMLRLAALLGVPHKNVFAVGDGENDVDLLRAAAVGFVPQNGSEVAKRYGQQIVRGNDDGAVAHVIELLDRRFS